MEILYFRELSSTQSYLVENIRNGSKKEIAVVASIQTQGVGSRGDSWVSEEGNLFASFALKEESLPADLPKISFSVYFSWLMVEVLRELGSEVWLKWPNDLYLGGDKVGGVITNYLKGFLVVGVGINLKNNGTFRGLDIEVEIETILKNYIKKLESPKEWRVIHRDLEVEFERSRDFKIHSGDEVLGLKDAKFLPDGSLEINHKRVVSAR